MSDRSWAGQVARNRVRNEQRKRKVAAERAVIEAARTAKRDLRTYSERFREVFGNSNPYYEHSFEKLLRAIEALQEEVERE
jgi:uncharacterized protein with WD repeat